MIRRLLYGWMFALLTLVGMACETSDKSQSRGERPSNQSAERPTQSPSSETSPPGPGPYEYERSIGTEGTAPGEFLEPVGLAIGPEKNVYVSDTHNRRLQMLSPVGESLEVWANGIERPMHIGFGRDGRLLVPVFQKDEIRIFDGPGEPVETFGGEWLDGPAGIAQGPDGKIYVADFYNHRFHVLSSDGERRETIGEKGTEPAQFTYPTDIAVASDGTIWVADAYAHRIQIFSPSLEHRRTIGGWGKKEPGKFRVATGIDVGPNGHLFVADFKNNRVQVLRPDGTPVAILDGAETGEGTLQLPTEVVRTNSKLYVADHGHHQIDVYAIRDGSDATD